MNRISRPKLKGLAFAGLFALALPVMAHAREVPDMRGGVAIPAHFSEISGVAGPVSSQDAWWKAFGDPGLDDLVERLHKGSTQIQQAAARLAMARAQARSGAASQMPLAGVSGSASHASGPLINKAGGSGDLFTAGLAISWEIDLLSRMSGERAAEKLDVRAAEATLRSTRLLMEAQVARSYFRTIFLNQAVALAGTSAALWSEREVMAKSRAAHGLASALDLSSLHQHVIASASEAATLRRAQAEERDALAFLIGAAMPPDPGRLDLPVPPDVPAGLPSQVLARRPDVNAAIARLQAAEKRQQSAGKSWLPSFSLTASGGSASPTLGQLLSSSARSFGLDLLFAVPLFDGGRRKAMVAGREAERELAGAQYREAMLNALREVNDALATRQASNTRADLAAQSLALGREEEAIIARRAMNGTASRAMLVEARLVSLTQQEAELRARFERLGATIDLVKATGGGWGLAD